MKKLFFIMLISSTAYSSINNEMYENQSNSYNSTVNLNDWYALSDRERRDFITMHLGEDILRNNPGMPIKFAYCSGDMIAKQLTRNEVREYPIANAKNQYLNPDRYAEIMSNVTRDVAKNCANYAK